jgi:hypothetical protein
MFYKREKICDYAHNCINLELEKEEILKIINLRSYYRVADK